MRAYEINEMSVQPSPLSYIDTTRPGLPFFRIFLASMALNPRTGTCWSCAGLEAPHDELPPRGPPCPPDLSRFPLPDWRCDD